MTGFSRRQHLKQLGAVFGATMSGLAPAFAADPEIPPEGIGKGIKHLSYSDIGGKPDSVQVMLSNKHLYVGHMFSDGVTILDAADPRNLKPVGFFTAGQFTRTHHLQTSDNLMLLANGANIVAMQSYDSMRGYFENALATASPIARNFAPACRSTTFRNRRRCAKSRSWKCRASASTGCGGRAGDMPMSRRISTASPTTFSASSICRTSPSPRSFPNGGCPG